jgi:hypothetical protein
MARLLRNATFLAIMIGTALIAKPALAAGGTCPSATNYLNPSTGSLVTLSSLGVTNCYFIAAIGSDSNSGTSESSPWLHAPEMLNCSANCAALQNSNTMNGTSAAGSAFIFRGGDTWHFGIATDSAGQPSSGGTWNWNSGPNGKYPNGTSSNPIYIGVDQSWYSGASWSRPILNADNPICNSKTLSGACALVATPQWTQSGLEVQVPSCAHQIVTNGGGQANDVVAFSNRQYYIFDNFELTGLCIATSASDNVYVSYNSSQAGPWLINLYIHGWSHVQWASEPPNGSCNSSSAPPCFGIEAFGGSGPVGNGDVFRYDIVDGSDSDPIGAGACYCGWYDVAYSIFRYESQGISRGQTHLIHDNIFEYVWDNGHTDVAMIGEAGTGVNAFYNNIFRHNFTSGAGGVAFWAQHTVGTGYTDYIFNNLIYDTQGETWNLGADVGGISGLALVFNNTAQKNSTGPIVSCSTSSTSLVAPVTFVNNHWINDASPYNNNCAPQETAAPLTEKIMTNAQATTAGYTSSQSYVYSPTLSSSPTVNAGTSKASFCSALSTAAGSDPTLANVSVACSSDTPYACTYNTSTHTNACPARTPDARPSVAWDAGAYQFSSAQAQAPQPPTNLQASVQ